MNVFRELGQAVRAALRDVADGLDAPAAGVELPRDPAHGDFATNAAMISARAAGRKPRDLADALAERLRADGRVASAETAGPGFVNLRMAPGFWRAQVPAILAAGPAYGDSDGGAGRRVNVEYVSTNPTGPLHVGHARGAVFGDALARLLAKAGYDVTTEYYINDAGAQVDALGRSVHHRYLEALGDAPGPMAEDMYPGDYLKPVGAALAEEFGPRYRDAGEAEWLAPFRDRAVAAMMAAIREDLAAAGIEQEVFTSERALVESGGVERAIAGLEQEGLVYWGVLDPPKGRKPEDWEPGRRQMLFRSTGAGDDVDRPLKKSDGGWTYFASDIAYHMDKAARGFEELIDVWGADHGGYVKRMQAAVSAATGARLDVKLCQLVRVLRGGELVRMSKRSGDFVTLREVVDEVGRDALRFLMLTRRNDAPLDFDLAQAVAQSRDNPVFYVQYAHARCCSVLRHGEGIGEADEEDLAHLEAPEELALVRRLAAWPHTVETAAAAHEPHRAAFYLMDAATDFHALWTKGRENARLRFIQEDDPAGTRARLALVRATAIVIAGGLRTLGVEPVERM
ncbi:MAG: arginine--tRNA ligase [Alphaproteobacteria bacterium]|nr:arginine--tRNA ligase [Alphaproteobacteria bacterium]